MESAQDSTSKNRAGCKRMENKYKKAQEYFQATALIYIWGNP